MAYSYLTASLPLTPTTSSPIVSPTVSSECVDSPLKMLVTLVLNNNKNQKRAHGLSRREASDARRMECQSTAPSLCDAEKQSCSAVC